MSNLDNVYALLKENKKNIEEGRINGIPFPIPQFSDCYPLIKQGQYILISSITKGSKSQFTNYAFIFETLFYAMEHPDLVRAKFLYFNFEESQEDILMRFMSYCLYKFDKIRISPLFLQSPNEKHLLSNDVLRLLESDRYKAIFTFFDEHIEFCEARTSIAMDIKIKEYAYSHGSATYKTSYYKDKETNSTHETKSIDVYTPNDPLEYVFIIYDHISLVQLVQGQTLLQAIGEVSKKNVYYKNVFKYIPIMIQQQSKELGGLEANKQGRIRPSSNFLADNKSTANDCTQFFGLTDPAAFEVPEYFGFNIKRLGHNFRILELIANRSGEANKMVPLFFDGAVNYFGPMPLPDEQDKLERVYKHIEDINRKQSEENKEHRKSVSFFIKSKLFNHENKTNQGDRRKDNQCIQPHKRFCMPLQRH